MEEDHEEYIELNDYKEYWREKGRYYGYPECCIEWFCNSFLGELTPEQEAVHGNKGFIPCPHHAKQVFEGETTMENLIQNRKCVTSYPVDDYDVKINQHVKDDKTGSGFIMVSFNPE